MTKPQFTAQISLGAMLQLGALVVSIAVGFAFVRATSEQNRSEIARQEVFIERLEARLRAVEVSNAGERAEFAAIKEGLATVDGQVRENRKLLLQILGERGSQR